VHDNISLLLLLLLLPHRSRRKVYSKMKHKFYVKRFFLKRAVCLLITKNMLQANQPQIIKMAQ